MVILDGIFGENEFRYFNDELTNALTPLIDAEVSHLLYKYMTKPEADPELVARAKAAWWDKVIHIENNNKLMSPEIQNVLRSAASVDIYVLSVPEAEQLLATTESIEDITKECTLYIAPRSKEDFEHFMSLYKALILSGKITEPTYPNMLPLVIANSVILYRPHEQEIQLPAAYASRIKTYWYSVHQGLQWRKYCSEHKLVGEQRYTL